jgi:SNF2 family DNA or RNA helicase
MKYIQKPYQKQIVDFILKNEKCNIFAGMGVGKTSSTLTALLPLIEFDNHIPLILAPLRVADNTWSDEVNKWDHLSHLRVSKIIGSISNRKKALKTVADIYTINYESVPWLIEQPDLPFTMLVCDESTKLKSFRTHLKKSRAFAVARLNNLPQVTRHVNLTGTPSPNGLIDIWGQQYFIDKFDSLGRFKDFKANYFRTVQVGKSEFAVKINALEDSMDKVAELIRPSTLTLQSKDLFNLKETRIVNVPVKLTKSEHRDYKKLEKELVLELSNSNITALNAASLSQKCLQFAGGAIYKQDDELQSTKEFEVIHNHKIDALDSIINENNGENLLVAYQYKHDLERLLKHYPKAKVLDKNPETIKEWNTGEISLLLFHPASAGHGLNLQHGGSKIVFFNNSWNLEYKLQAIERVGAVRQLQSGYDRECVVYNIVTINTIDELVLDRVSEKESLAEYLLKKLS